MAHHRRTHRAGGIPARPSTCFQDLLTGASPSANPRHSPRLIPLLAARDSPTSPPCSPSQSPSCCSWLRCPHTSPTATSTTSATSSSASGAPSSSPRQSSSSSSSAWTLFRSYDPFINHTEQPMDLALLSASINSQVGHPEDPWLRGEPVSYYYFGLLDDGRP